MHYRTLHSSGFWCLTAAFCCCWCLALKRAFTCCFSKRLTAQKKNERRPSTAVAATATKNEYWQTRTPTLNESAVQDDVCWLLWYYSVCLSAGRLLDVSCWLLAIRWLSALRMRWLLVRIMKIVVRVPREYVLLVCKHVCMGVSVCLCVCVSWYEFNNSSCSYSGSLLEYLHHYVNPLYSPYPHLLPSY